MLRVVMCGNISIDDGSSFRSVLERIALESGCSEFEIEELNVLDMVDRANHPRGEAPSDLLLLANDLPGMSGVEALRDIRQSGSQIRAVLFSNDVEAAPEALELKASGFLPNPVSRLSLERTLRRVIPRIVRFHKDSVLLKLHDRSRRIPFDQLLYAETQGHDQLLHVAGGATYSIRSTSQALFDQLNHDERFFKAGSSYIINLQHVESVGSGDGMVTLSNSSQIGVPVRLRKALETALMEGRRPLVLSELKRE